MAEMRFTICAHIGGGPWKWSVWDDKQQKVVGLYIVREDAMSSAQELNETGYVDV